MDKYPLAKLVQWAGTVRSRKRLQKVAYFLQEAGCPLDADYTLHLYGPYSRDVAEVCDELVASGVLKEETSSNNVGVEYAYALTEQGRLAVGRTEADPRFEAKVRKLADFQPLAVELFGKSVADLEIGSTILYFKRKVSDWDDAISKACEFKRVDRTSGAVASQAALAKWIAEGKAAGVA